MATEPSAAAATTTENVIQLLRARGLIQVRLTFQSHGRMQSAQQAQHQAEGGWCSLSLTALGIYWHSSDRICLQQTNMMLGLNY